MRVAFAFMCKIRTLVRSLFRRARCNAIASSILLFAIKPVVIVVLSVQAHTLVIYVDSHRAMNVFGTHPLVYMY